MIVLVLLSFFLLQSMHARQGKGRVNVFSVCGKSVWGWGKKGGGGKYACYALQKGSSGVGEEALCPRYAPELCMHTQMLVSTQQEPTTGKMPPHHLSKNIELSHHHILITMLT